MSDFFLSRDFINFFAIVFGSFSILFLTTFFIKPEPALASSIIDFGLFFIVLITLIFFLKKKSISWEEFGFRNVKFKWIFYSFLLIILVVILGTFLSELLARLIGIKTDNYAFLKAIIGDTKWINILGSKIAITILIPFSEEVLFRGFLFKYIRQEKSFIFSAILSSLLFSLMHFSLDSLPFTFLLGFSTAFVYEKGKSLFYPFLIHMGANNLGFTMATLSLFK